MYFQFFRSYNYNDSRWSSRKQFLSYPNSSIRPQYNMSFTNLQLHRNNNMCECLKMKRKNDSMIDPKFVLSHETHSFKYKPQSMKYKEKPTIVIFKNRTPNRSKNLKSYNSPTTSIGTIESSVNDSLDTCPRSIYKSPRYTNDRYKYNKYNTKIDPLLLSSSSKSSLSKRCHSWSILSQNSICHRQEPISSSCMNIQLWNRFPENEKRRNTYLCSSSCSCSTSSLSTFKDDYSLTETDTEPKQVQRLEKKKPKFCAQKKKIIYMDERHVRWNIKNTY